MVVRLERRGFKRVSIVRPQEEEGFDLTLDVDKSRFVEARDGDNLMICF